jgi:predicted nucleotidyltransferase
MKRQTVFSCEHASNKQLEASSSVNIEPRLNRIVSAQPYPLIFATISGAHLYGFPSPDSDYDLRGAHVLPLENVWSLEVRDETVQDSRVMEGLEMDIVSHDARKLR